MFKAKQLDKLVKAGIISVEQQKQILAFDDTSGGGFVMRALNLLAIFTIGIGIISLVASNWEYIGDNLKLILMFAVLCGAAGRAVWCKSKGQGDRAEKWLAALFLFIGAAIGLVIQVYHLSGNIYHLPLAFWWAATLPLLFAAKKKYVAWFWTPLFLAWCAMYTGGRHWLEILLAVYAVMYAGGWALNVYKPQIAASSVFKRDAFLAFYIVLAIYILWYKLPHFVISAMILLVTSFIYQYFKEYRKVRLNVKFAGLWVFSLYIWLGDEIGLFSTGIGLILSGAVLMALIKGVSRLSKKFNEDKKHA